MSEADVGAPGALRLTVRSHVHGVAVANPVEAPTLTPASAVEGATTGAWRSAQRAVEVIVTLLASDTLVGPGRVRLLALAGPQHGVAPSV